MLDLFIWSDQHLRSLRVILSRQFASSSTARLAAAAHFAAVRRAAPGTDRRTGGQTDGHGTVLNTLRPHTRST